jgi:hypothetical protein
MYAALEINKHFAMRLGLLEKRRDRSRVYWGVYVCGIVKS